MFAESRPAISAQSPASVSTSAVPPHSAVGGGGQHAYEHDRGHEPEGETSQRSMHEQWSLLDAKMSRVSEAASAVDELRSEATTAVLQLKREGSLRLWRNGHRHDALLDNLVRFSSSLQSADCK